jgi:cytochrome c oxidase subunit III
MMTFAREPLAHHFESLEQQRDAGRLGMWVFLGTELMVFGGLFTGYAAYRASYPEAFAAASQHLNLLIGGVNTVVLLTSSLTMALAVRAAQIGERRALVTFLLLTALLGTGFMVLKAIEYYEDYRDQLVPGFAFDPLEWRSIGVKPEQAALFLLCYYCMTGLHALHLIAGITILLILAVLAGRGAFPRENYAPVELTGLYWHFVDIVWIFLLPLLYLVGTRTSWY